MDIDTKGRFTFPGGAHPPQSKAFTSEKKAENKEQKDTKRIETKEQKNARLAAFEKDMLPVKRESNWQLNRVDDIAWTQDKSGLYCYINWDLLTDSVRIDSRRGLIHRSWPIWLSHLAA